MKQAATFGGCVSERVRTWARVFEVKVVGAALCLVRQHCEVIPLPGEHGDAPLRI